jgi:hypothetical protein
MRVRFELNSVGQKVDTCDSMSRRHENNDRDRQYMHLVELMNEAQT